MPTILAVVTDLFFAVKVSSAAKTAGREVKFANTLDQAVDLARSLQPVLLVVDLGCREVDCLTLIERWRADPALEAIPSLGFVAHVREDLKKSALAAGYTKVVAKSTFSDKAALLLAAGATAA